MNEPDDQDGEDYASEHYRRIERFIALGGGVPLQQELRNLERIKHGEKVTLKENITDGHRALVADMAAAGMDQEMIAKVMGISMVYLRQLFELELETGFDMAKANLIRNLYIKGMAGDTSAIVSFLRYHNRSNWRSKAEVTGKDDGPIQAEVTQKGKVSLSEAKAWLSAMVPAMMQDKELVGNGQPPKPLVPGKAQTQKENTRLAKRLKPTVRRKPREEDIEDDDEA